MYKIKSIILSGILAFCNLCATAQNIDSGQAYEIHTLSGLAMDNQESVDTGSKIFISRRVPGKESQIWQFIPIEKDIYCIVSPLSQQAIDNGGDGAVERSILQWSNDEQLKPAMES